MNSNILRLNQYVNPITIAMLFVVTTVMQYTKKVKTLNPGTLCIFIKHSRLRF